MSEVCMPDCGMVVVVFEDPSGNCVEEGLEV